MKRSIKIIAFLLVCISFNLIVPQAFAKELSGDIDGDGIVTSVDARLALRYSAKMEKPTASQQKLADVNDDGSVTITDVKRIMANALDLETYGESLLKKGFPISYVEPLEKLYARHPNWVFVPMLTGLDWQASINGERDPHSQQLIENNVQASFMCSCSMCKGVIQEGSNWVSASEEAVKYYMDPRNFLTEEYIFQFESTAYDKSHTLQGVEAILKGTWMYDSDITYLNGNGAEKTYKEDGKAVKYSEAIMKAAKDSGMSAYFLASKIVQEVGSSTSSYAGGSSGKNAPFYGIYNYYNIGAYTGVRDGLEWANGYLKTIRSVVMYKTAKVSDETVVTIPGNSEIYYISSQGDFYRISAIVNGKTYKGYVKKDNVSIYTSYGRPWTNPYKTIYYGAQYIYDSFSKTQYTGYLQKFNVNPESENLYNHEYMGNVRAAASEAYKTYKAYTSANILENKKVFSIPVFENMPGANVTAKELFKNSKPVLKVTEYTESSVTLSWSALENAELYQVYKYNSETKKYKKIKTTSQLKFTDKGLSSGELPSYKIRGYYRDEDGDIIYSSFSSVFKASVKPPKIDELNVASFGDSYVKLKWKNLSCTGYIIYRYDDILGGYKELKRISITENKTISYADKTVLSGTAYKYKLRTYIKTEDRIFYSDYSPEISVTTTGDVPEIIPCPYAEPTATVRHGDNGVSVKWVQWHLYKLGYLTKNDIDGVFGSGTESAVKAFQTAEKLDVDGLVGPDTREAMKTKYGA